MDLWELLMITIRRWKITVPVAILAFGGAFMAAQSTPPEYTADAAVGLIGAGFSVDPNTGEIVEEDNPLVVANQGRTALAFTEKSVTSSDEKRSAVENGFSENYTVTLDRFNPILEIDVVATDPDTAVATAGYVVELIKADVIDTQVIAGEDDENLQLRPTELYVDEVAGEDVTPRSRMLVILLVIALMVTIGAAVLADAYFALRERGRQGRTRRRDEGDDETEDWDDAQELIDSAMRVREVTPVSAGPDLEEWGRR